MKNNFPKIAKKEFKALGTDVDIQIIVQNPENELQAKNDLAEIEKSYRKFEKIFSRFDENSELSRLNAHLGEFLFASEEMKEIVSLALYFYKKTDGMFDPRIIEVLENIGYDRDFKKISSSGIFKENKNSFRYDLFEDLLIKNGNLCFKKRMDFSGIAKGYITDKIVEFLFGKGYQNFLVDSGGDMFLAGKDEKDSEWTVEIEGIDSSKLLLKLKNMAVATSGISRRKWEANGQRFHHLIDPKNPENFSFDLRSVTAVAEKTIKADVLAKTLFLLGKDGAKKYADKKGVVCAILEYRGNAWISKDIKKYLC